MVYGKTMPKYHKLALDELILEEPFLKLLYAYAGSLDEGGPHEFPKRFTMDHIDAALSVRAALIKKALPEEIESLE